MSLKVNIEWDYNGWRKHTCFDDMIQNDWNQTLITRINQISATIYQASDAGGANTLKMHSHIFKIVKTLMYIRQEEDGNYVLSGRYKIIIDDSLLLNKLYVIKEDYPMCLVNIYDYDGETHATIHSESPLLKDYKTKGEYKLKIITPDIIRGEITIKNYD